MVIEWAQDDKDEKYLSLFQHIALKKTLIPNRALKKFHQGIPYGNSCPSVRGARKAHLCALWYVFWYYQKEKVIARFYSTCRSKGSPPANRGLQRLEPEYEEPETRQPLRLQRIAARRQEGEF